MDEASIFARNIRELRASHGLTQAQLATEAGMPRSTLSTIELGDGNPTLHALLSLARALGVPLDELLTTRKQRAEHFKRSDIHEEQRGPAKRVRVQKLLPHKLPGVEIDRFELPIGSRLPGIPHRRGTYEYLYCEKGSLDIHLEGDHFSLAKGEVLAFAGDQRHSYHHKGRGPTVAFSVVLVRPEGAV